MEAMNGKARVLETTDYDVADRALDKIAFVKCAVSDMMSNYSDNITNGLVAVLEDAEAELRRYMESARATLLDIESEQESM